MKKINIKNSSFVIFTVISICYLIGNIVWWYLNTPIIPTDMAALHFLDIFANECLYYNAPLITWIMKLMFFIFGKEYFDLQIIIVNYFFFLIGLYFIYKIGLELKDKETGNIAMILFALTPAVYGMSRQYGHQDWHVMIAMIANIYCLIKLDNFKDRKWSILYGITVGLGLLIKDEFLAYFFTPWLYVVIRSLIQKIELKKILNIFITILIGCLLAGCHYFRLEIINKVLNEPIVEREPISFNFESLIGFFSEYLLSPPLFILFIISFVWFIYKYKNKNKLIILLWFIIPWAIIAFMPHRKLPEYYLGLIPAIILIICVCVSNLKVILIKKLILIFCTIICFLEFLHFSFDNNINLFRFDENNLFYIDKRLIGYDKSSITEYTKIITELKPYLQTKIYLETYSIDHLKLNLMILLILDNTTFFEQIYEYCNIDLFHINNTNETISEEQMNSFFDNVTIVTTEQYSTLDFAEYFYYSDSATFGKDDEYKNILIKKYMERMDMIKKYINNNFSLKRTFYLENIKNEGCLVKIYTK